MCELQGPLQLLPDPGILVLEDGTCPSSTGAGRCCRGFREEDCVEGVNTEPEKSASVGMVQEE